MPPTNRAFEQALKQTLEKFEARMTKRELDGFQVATLADVQVAVARMQHERDHSKRMNNLRRIQRFLEGMDQLGKVVEVFLNVSDLVAFIWGPIKFVLLAANTHVDTLNTLVEAYESIGEQLPLLETYRKLFEHSPDMHEALVWIYEDILEFHQSAIRHFQGKCGLSSSCQDDQIKLMFLVWQQVFTATWNNFKSRFGDILIRLGRHGAFVKDKAYALHIEQSDHMNHQLTLHLQTYTRDFQKLQEQIMQYGRERELRRKEFEAKSLLDTQKLQHESLVWIAAADMDAELEMHEKARVDDDLSGQWILNHDVVSNWKDAEVPNRSILWLSGKPGAGKTVLASVLISNCLKIENYGTSFFFCRYSDPDKKTALAVLRGLLGQLLVACPELLPPFNQKRWALGKGETTLNLIDSAKTLLEMFCKRRPNQYIIIDGLDECEKEERAILLEFFKSLVRNSDLTWNMPGALKVLFVSQHMSDISKQLTPDVATSLQLSDEDNKGDISRYIDIWSDRIGEEFKLNAEEKDEMKRSTKFRAAGMFLFAKLVMHNLFIQTKKKDVQAELHKSVFPKGLPDAYKRILSRMKRSLPAPEWKQCITLMGWLICTKRPLRLREIRGALLIDEERRIIDPNLKVKQELQNLCAPLVQDSGGLLQLVHGTAANGILASGCVSEPIVECDLTTLCLNYLTFGSFNNKLQHEEITGFAMDGYYTFMDYAIAKWIHHFQATVFFGERLCDPESGDQDLSTTTQTERMVHQDDIDIGPNARKEQSQAALLRLQGALDSFSEVYEDELFGQLEPTKADEEACQALGNQMYGETIQYVFTHIRSHLAKDFRAKADVSIEVLGEAVKRIRQAMEDYHSTNKGEIAKERFETLYGVNIYKCPKTTCSYFHQGFQDQRSRDEHINDHDRPYQCDVPNCMHSELGFRYNKDLDKHRKEWHPSLEDLATSFIIPEKPTTGRTYKCEICIKSFVRASILKDHMNSHLGERPHACSECGKSFTRKYDCKRHEAKVHAAKRRR